MSRVGIFVVAVAASLPSMANSAERVRPSFDAMALDAIDRRLVEIDAEEGANKTELSRTSGRIAIAHARVVAHGRAFYRLTRAGLLPVGGGFGALVTHAMHVERARRLVGADLVSEQSLHARAEDLGRGLERLARDRVNLAVQRQAMDAARLASQDEARRQAAFDRAFETSTGGGGDYVAVYGGVGGVTPSDGPGNGFAAARGRLLFPVVGRAEVRAVRREGTGGPGLEIRAAAGAGVRAAFAGRVAFADRFGPYGRIVILDHGAHYYTVSGNLDQVGVKVGQDIAAGERIGTVGDEGAGSLLYFEVRQGSQTVAPAPWLGLSASVIKSDR